MTNKEEKTAGTMPCNVEAERAILGAVLNHKTVTELFERLKPEDFYNQANKLIANAIFESFQNNKPIDVIVLDNMLQSADEYKKVGGLSYLESLKNKYREPAITPYIDIVGEKSRRRKELLLFSNAYLTILDEKPEAGTISDSVTAELLHLNKGISDRYRALSDISNSLFEKTIINSQRKDKYSGFVTGIEKLDDITRGLQRKELLLFAARPSMGKTSIAVSIICNVVRRGSKEVIVFFSLEMDKESLFIRILCNLASLTFHQIISGNLTDKEWARFVFWLRKMDEANVFIDDRPGLTPIQMLAVIREMKALKGRVDLVLEDYIQLGNPSKKAENRNLELEQISKDLKNIAKQEDIPFVALSQLSRANEKRTDKRPQLSDLRDSGALEQNIDLCCFIHREEYYDKNPDFKNLAELIIAKQRNGSVGTLNVAYINQFMRFENIKFIG